MLEAVCLSDREEDVEEDVGPDEDYQN